MGQNQKLQFTEFDSLTAVRPRPQSERWGRVLGLLSQYEIRTEKGGPLWSPAVYRAGATRGNAGVVEITALVLDYDQQIPPETVAHWETLGLEYCWHSTFQHTIQNQRLRVVFPFSRPVRAEDWPRVWPLLVRHLRAEGVDSTCKDLARMFFWPIRPAGGAMLYGDQPGVWLDPYQIETAPPDEPDLYQPGPARLESARREAGRVRPEMLLDRAMQQPGGRHQACLWLVSQAWDNDLQGTEVEHLALSYAAQCPQPTGKDPFGDTEALRLARWVQTRPRREPWSERQLWVSLSPDAPPDLEAVLAGLRQDRARLWQPAILQQLLQLRRDSPVAWAATRDRIKTAGVSLRDLESALRAVAESQSTAPDSSGDAGLPRAVDHLFDARWPEMVIPPPWRLRPTETGMMAEGDGGPRWQRIAYGPVQITGRAQSADGRIQRLVVAWRREGSGWQSRMIDRGTLLRVRTIGELASLGFPYSDSRAVELVRYLADVEAANLPHLPCTTISTSLGWQAAPTESDRTPFLLGDRILIAGEDRPAQEVDLDHPEAWQAGQIILQPLDPGTQTIANAVHPRGTWDGWLRAVRMAAPHPAVMLAIYASLVSPLLRVLGVPNFGVEWSCPTSKGKTTSMHLGGSVWGQPDENRPSSVVLTWDVTQVYAEKVASLLGDLPLLLDDTKKATGRKGLVAGVIYMLAAGRTRGRGTTTGTETPVTWSGVLLSTGEESLTTLVQDGGAKTRMLQVTCRPLGSISDSEGDTLSKRLNAQVYRHYGHLGPRWIRHIQSRRAEWPVWREMYAALMDDYSEAGVSAESGRLAQYAAVLTLTREILLEAVPEWAEIGEQGDPMILLWPEVARGASDASGAQQALASMLAWVSAERSRMEETGMEEITSRVGLWQSSGAPAIYPHHVRRQLLDWGYSPGAILREWSDRGWIVPQGGHATRVVRIPGTDKVARMIAFTPAALLTLGDTE